MGIRLLCRLSFTILTAVLVVCGLARSEEKPETWLRGTVEGEDGLCVTCMVGADIHDARRVDRRVDGTPSTAAAYEAIPHVNLFYPCTPKNGMPEGFRYPCKVPEKHKVTEHTATKEFAVGPLAVEKGETWTVWLELYPKEVNAEGKLVTCLDHYGRAQYHAIPVSYGETKRVSVHLPHRENYASISGSVTEDGSPVAKVAIRAWGNGADTGIGMTETDENGKFTLTALKTWCVPKTGERQESVGYRLFANHKGRHFLGRTLTVRKGDHLQGADFVFSSTKGFMPQAPPPAQ